LANSLAVSGLGTIIAISPTSSTGTFTTIGEITNAPQSGRQTKTADVTNLQSSTAEFIATLIDSGTYEITMNRVSTDAGQTALETAFEALSRPWFKITLPKQGAQTTAGDSYTFQAVIEEKTDLSELGPDKAIRSRVRLKVSGLVDYTAGS
jgi:hypothetical protein